MQNDNWPCVIGGNCSCAKLLVYKRVCNRDRKSIVCNQFADYSVVRFSQCDLKANIDMIEKHWKINFGV